MICFQYTIERLALIYDNVYYPIYCSEHFQLLRYFFMNYCQLKKLQLEKLRIVFHCLFHILFLYDNQYLIKVVYEDMSNIEEQYLISSKSPLFGNIYEIFIVNNTLSKIITMEYITAILGKNIIMKQKCPFIFFYSLTIDYLNAIRILHENNYIHSCIKPVQLMVMIGSHKNYGKLVGLEDIVKIEYDKQYYYNTSGSINFLSPERYEYFQEHGFFGMTSRASDIWELFYSLLYILDIIIVDEFFELLHNNFEILHSYLLNKIVHCFQIHNQPDLIELVEKYLRIFLVGLHIDEKHRPNKADWYLEQLLGYKILDRNINYKYGRKTSY